MTLQTPELLTEHEARRLTERIRTRLDRVSTAWADLGESITEAYQRRADLALGYSSWSEYAEAELKPAEGLAAEVRRQLVGMLTAAGMSTRAIAPTVGVNDSRVRQIRREVGSDYPPAQVLPEVTPERIDPATGEVLDMEPYPQLRRAPWPERRDEPVADPTSVTVGGGEAPTVAEPHLRAGTPPVPVITVEEQEIGAGAPPAPRPATITGLDGKQYTRPEPSTPRRKALPEQFLTATLALTDKVQAIVRLAEDDRFTANAEKVATANRSDLIRAIDALSGVVAKLPERNIS